MIELKKVTFSYGEAPALRECSVELGSGALTGLIGPNGAGKSTLLKVMAGLLRPAMGSVDISGQPLATIKPRQRAQQLAFVPQRTEAAFAMSVRELVMLGRTPYQRGLAWESANDRRATEQALMQMDCTRLASRSIDTLSGGEWQRVVVARALAQEPRVLLLDEPIAHLDPAYQLHLMTLLRTMVDQHGLTICCALHDINLAARFCDRLLLLRDGEIVANGTAQDVATPEQLTPVFQTQMQWERALVATKGLCHSCESRNPPCA